MDLMTDNIVYFENIQARPDKQRVMFRLGYKKGMTQMSEAQSKTIEGTIEDGFSFCELKGAYSFYDVLDISESAVALERGITLESADIISVFSGCSRALIMASTAGNTVIEKRDIEVKNGNGSTALVLDAAASETADFGLDWMQEYLEGQLIKKSMSITRRFSPGYGDLGLSHQKQVYDRLKLEKIGMSITERFILVPEKSVIGICGIR
jgi:hypothetical protein